MTDNLVDNGVCVRCGYSHCPPMRRKAIRRMLPCEAALIVDAWPCRYEGKGGRRALLRDLHAIGAQPDPTPAKFHHDSEWVLP